MSSIAKYSAFVKTVEFGSFTKAAEALAYSQSGISRMIGDLEAEWGTTLLERSSAGLRLTSEGLQLLPFAKQVCESEDRLQEQVCELAGVQRGLIRIGTFSSVATHWLPNIIARFRDDYPGVEYELVLGDYDEIERWIIESRVDCGFVRMPVKSDLDTDFLEQDRLVAVLPYEHPLAARERLPVQALGEEPFLLLEKDGVSDVAELLATWGIEPDAKFTTWDDYAILAMVERGLGISVLPELILRRVPYRVEVRELAAPAYRSICFATKRGRKDSKVVERFRSYLKHRADDCRNPPIDSAP